MSQSRILTGSLVWGSRCGLRAVPCPGPNPYQGRFVCCRFSRPISQTMSDESIVVVRSVAYGQDIQHGYFTDKAGARTNLAVWEHVSFGYCHRKADLMPKL